MDFLKKKKEEAEYIVADTRSDGGRKATTFVTGGFIRRDKDEREDKGGWRKGVLMPCLACHDPDSGPPKEEHRHMMSECPVWRELTLSQKVEKLDGGCTLCAYLSLIHI